MKKVLFVVAILTSTVLTSCGGGAYADSSDGVKQLAADLNTTKEMTLLNSLKPTEADCKAIFKDEADANAALEMINAQYEELSNMEENPIHAKDGQTEILVKTGKVGGDLSSVSGGFERIADKLVEGTTIYEIKYVEPGKELGMKFSAFIYVNGAWKFFGKLYRAF